MSGLEAAGVVLGAIPLIIAAIEHHQDIKALIQAPFKYQQKLQDFISHLRLEYLFLGKYLARLFESVGVDVDENDPQDCRKALLDEEMRKRVASDIGLSLSLLDGVLQRFERSLEAIVVKLPIFKNQARAGTVSLNEILNAGFPRQEKGALRHRLIFTIRYSSLKSLLDELRCENQAIVRIADFHNAALQAKTANVASIQARRINGYYSRVRQAADSFSGALESTLKGSCQHVSHKMFLQLETRLSNQINATLKDRTKVQTMPVDFNIWFAGENEEPYQRRWQTWQKARLQDLPDEPHLESPRRSGQDVQRVRSASIGIRGQINVSRMRASGQNHVLSRERTSWIPMSNAPPSADSFPYNALDEVDDMCTIMNKARTRTKVLVFRTATSQKLLFEQLEELHTPVPETMLSLDVLLRRSRRDRTYLLKAEERLRLAVDLTTSLLQLSNTAWHSDAWHKDNVHFPFRTDRTLGPCFISRQFQAQGTPAKPRSEDTRSNRVFLELAILLQEIFTNRTLEQYAKEERMNLVGTDSARLVLIRKWFEAECHQYLPCFCDVIEGCLKLIFKQRAWTDERLRESVFEDIVTPLWDTLTSQYPSQE